MISESGYIYGEFGKDYPRKIDLMLSQIIELTEKFSIDIHDAIEREGKR